MENVKNNKLVYVFDIYKYTNQVIYCVTMATICSILQQVKQQLNNKVDSLKDPLPLVAEEFKKVLQPSSTTLLVTLAPLFACLND